MLLSLTVAMHLKCPSEITALLLELKKIHPRRSTNIFDRFRCGLHGKKTPVVRQKVVQM